MTTPTPQQPALPPISFGLCGATGGGKTTFLIALSLAVQQAERRGLGQWTMRDGTEQAGRFIQQGQQDLANKTFPIATGGSGSHYSWEVYGPRRKQLLGLRSKEIRFTLDVDDLPGAAFKLDDPSFVMPADSLQRLAEADALIFLIDPSREHDRAPGEDSNWIYFANLIRTIVRERGDLLRNGRLPHHVVVCVTKFDEPSIFLDAFVQGLVDVLPGQQPRVPDDRAKEYLDWMCDWVDRARGDGLTRSLLDLIGGHFVKERIHHFVTSSVGFWMPGGGADCDLDDFQNVARIGGVNHVRGAVNPINVLESLMRLEEGIRKDGKK
jgi:hypothetical protein